jgi:hypothetical protein
MTAVCPPIYVPKIRIKLVIPQNKANSTGAISLQLRTLLIEHNATSSEVTKVPKTKIF